MTVSENSTAQAGTALTGAWELILSIMQWMSNKEILTIFGIRITFLALPVACVCFSIIIYLIHEVFYE